MRFSRVGSDDIRGAISASARDRGLGPQSIFFPRTCFAAGRAHGRWREQGGPPAPTYSELPARRIRHPAHENEGHELTFILELLNGLERRLVPVQKARTDFQPFSARKKIPRARGRGQQVGLSLPWAGCFGTPGQKGRRSITKGLDVRRIVYLRFTRERTKPRGSAGSFALGWRAQ